MTNRIKDFFSGAIEKYPAFVKKTASVFNSLSRLFKKAARDLALVLYEDLEFKAMSLPRLLAASAGLMTTAFFISDYVRGTVFRAYNEIMTYDGIVITGFLANKLGSKIVKGLRGRETNGDEEI